MPKKIDWNIFEEAATLGLLTWTSPVPEAIKTKDAFKYKKKKKHKNPRPKKKHRKEPQLIDCLCGNKHLNKKQHYTSEDYQGIYLKSPHWKAVQKLMYDKHKKCQLCNIGIKRNIHHITYKRLGYEREFDLIVLCEDCHIVRVHQNKEFTKNQLRQITREPIGV